jgi:hypothetical protein
VAGVVPLASGQPFKFHFQLSEDGFLYIVGPGAGNLLTAFLTAKPAAISGVTTNRVAKASDYSFPSGLEHWLELDKKAGTEDYTIIFSREALSSPAFLTEQTTGEPLTDAQRSDLESFLSRHKTTEPVIEVNDRNSAEPFVQVKVPQGSDAANPIVFHIRIQHK